MDIVKIVGIGLIALVIAIIFKHNKPEFVIYVELIAGIMMLSLSFESINSIISYVHEIAGRVEIGNKFVGIMLKITGIAILAEFGASICKDAGECAIASKIEIGSKVVILTTAIPIISSLLEIILRLLP